MTIDWTAFFLTFISLLLSASFTLFLIDLLTLLTKQTPPEGKESAVHLYHTELEAN